MALDTYLEDSEKKRDAEMQLHDSREIIPSYWKAYNMGERVIEPEPGDIQTDDEIQQNSESHSQENLNIMKKVYGMR